MTAKTDRYTVEKIPERAGWCLIDHGTDADPKERYARFGNTDQGRDLARRNAKTMNGGGPDYLLWDDRLELGAPDIPADEATALTADEQARRDARLAAIHTLIESAVPDPAILTALRTLGVTEAELDAYQAGQDS